MSIDNLPAWIGLQKFAFEFKVGAEKQKFVFDFKVVGEKHILRSSLTEAARVGSPKFCGHDASKPRCIHSVLLATQPIVLRQQDAVTKLLFIAADTTEQATDPASISGLWARCIMRKKFQDRRTYGQKNSLLSIEA